MRKTSVHGANNHRNLAEAIILQSIEDLWNPESKGGSLLFFEGDGFALCSEIAGISYIKQLAMLRMLAYAGPKKYHSGKENIKTQAADIRRKQNSEP